MMTATQATYAPPAATAITALRWSDSSDDDTSMNSSRPLSRTAAMGSTAFSVQLMWRLRTTVSAGFTGHGVTVSLDRIGVGAFTAVSCFTPNPITERPKRQGWRSGTVNMGPNPYSSPGTPALRILMRTRVSREADTLRRGR